ncbi:Zwei Ig domain protein zig-1 [Caenorhabditis elegans]|uniref:Zwei Ig domain protein zig-1 n=1 Tax=Caenorhabditis elegans TaxID=6239 RepID=ZIG1_CAEEL|nr:Zwei Ig domain protein zig-1 [Caenorhabditis elegans]G5EGI7.1 RecName: Full=Zwei Ig domain protein zig-1; AltName: Full=2 Ig domain protein zig-1; Flags: Precursor [Caenorhabditis elegans]AAL59606.1 secreted 2-immunoglobulin-domain protein ZIG-1 [Caenorhabditis elegans]CAB05773.2 Zwei Ig domain protein zig-1 [Caenorhabditis elegans]|eukprot:NP_492608.2 Zwei Ig domain protein zig-1 [Caenorhabditis elegans]
MKNLLLITFFVVSTVTALGGRGSKSALVLVAARSSENHPLHATDPITIWCAPDNPQVVIKTAHFIRSSDNEKLEAALNPTKKNATYTFGSPSVKDAGEYKCELDTPHGKISHKVFIYSRPVVHSHEHFTEHEGHEFHLESTGTTVEKGESVTLTCPVTGYPKPVVKWTKDSAPLALSQSVSMEGSTVIVTNANYTDAGTYSCEAVNEYTVNGKTSKMLLVVDKMVDVRSEFQWVYPLAVILITIFLLVVIIVFCEWRNKKSTSKA